MARPSDFTMFPFDSVACKNEVETIACNIMVILGRTGDKFREIPWEEYKAERLKDGNFTYSEESYFNDVIKYCKSEDTVRLFSPTWDEVPHRIYLDPKPKKEPKRKIGWR